MLDSLRRSRRLKKGRRSKDLSRTGLADLHVHTSASDGTLTPEETVREAARVGLEAVGITDHDTIAGVEPALDEGCRIGVEVVPGVEINTDYGDKEVHILGYYIDYHSVVLMDYLTRLRQGRYERGKRIVDLLNTLGVKINYQRVLEIADGASVGRPHVARAIVEAGYADSLNTAFAKYLVRGAPAYVPRYRLTPPEAVEIVCKSRGVAVLAHPGKSKHDEIIPTLMKAGLKGLEAYHPDHTPEQSAYYVRLAQKYGLLVTGGSDSHGPSMIKPVPIGSVTVNMDVVKKLRTLARLSVKQDEVEGRQK